MCAAVSVRGPEITRHIVTFHVTGKACQIAQMLERTRIAFADHIRALIAVKHMDHLPRIAIVIPDGLYRGKIIFDHVANGICKIL